MSGDVRDSIRAAICVYCGANPGDDPIYLRTSRELGWALAANGFDLVYGGASIGLMGALADGALSAGGTVTGIVPAFLPDGKVHNGLTATHVVSSMHERKAMMIELGRAFVVLPGGLGTLDELFETLTWLQLGLHDKSVVLLNVAGYFDSLLKFLQVAHKRNFLLCSATEMLSVETDVNGTLARLRHVLKTAPDPQFPVATANSERTTA